MTREQFDKLEFSLVIHLSMEDEHTTTYQCTHPDYHSLALCTHVPYKDGEPKGRAYDHYMFQGKVYKSVDSLINAITAAEGKEDEPCSI